MEQSDEFLAEIRIEKLDQEVSAHLDAARPEAAAKSLCEIAQINIEKLGRLNEAKSDILSAKELAPEDPLPTHLLELHFQGDNSPPPPRRSLLMTLKEKDDPDPPTSQNSPRSPNPTSPNLQATNDLPEPNDPAELKGSQDPQ